MVGSWVGRLRWLRFVSSRPRVADLDQLVRRIEGDACRLGGVPPTTDRSRGDTDPGRLLVRLQRADEALGAVVRLAPAETVQAGGTRDACQRAAPAGAGVAAAVDEALPRGANQLIALRDEALFAADNEYTTASQVADRFFRGIGEILETVGINSTEPSERLDPARQHVVDTRPTDDTALHGQIADVVGPGYVFKGRVIRPEQVVVWRRTRSAASVDSPEGIR